MWGGWCTGAVSGPYGVSLWKNISQGCPSLSHFILYEIGDGLRVKFWQDQWCGETSCNSYLKLFRIYQEKKENVAEFMKFTNGFLHWDVSFFRVVNDWELEARSVWSSSKWTYMANCSPQFNVVSS